MRRRLLLLLPLLLGCQRPPHVVSERQRSDCRQAAEQAASPREALRRNGDCLADALNQPAPPSAPLSTAPVAAAAAPVPIDRYRYCRLHQEEVQAAVSRYTDAAKPWILAYRRSPPESEAYRTAQQAYDAAVADLARLLPPEIRNGMDLLPTAAAAYSRCDRQVVEAAAPT